MCIFTMSIPEGPIYKRDKKFYFMWSVIKTDHISKKLNYFANVLALANTSSIPPTK